MKFLSTALSAAALLTTTVTASPLTARAAAAGVPTVRRSGGGLMINATRPISPESQVTKADSYSSNWGGAVLVGNGISLASGTFVVPTPSTPSGGDPNTQYCGAAWVGIDGDTCQSGLIQTGVFWCVQNGQTSYEAWYEWIPQASIPYNGISVSGGDTISVTVTWTSPTSGTVYLVNESNGGNGFINFQGETAGTLCGENAEWIVEDFSVNGGLVPFANFGEVTFTGASAVVNGVNVDASGSEIIDLVNSGGQVITATSVNGGTVVVNQV